MQVYGIICECNPFHFGHSRIVQAARADGADAVIGVMSGDFVQRGEPACCSKFDRAEAMVKGGFDLVLELPVRYALSSSEGFAEAGVKMLEAGGTADVLMFGSECGDAELLETAAEILSGQNAQELIRALQEQGNTYPEAQETVLKEVFGEKASAVVRGGNNLLALDYLKALKTIGSGMVPKTVRRTADGFTAHGIRERVREGEDVTGLVPEGMEKALRNPDRRIDGESLSRTCLMALRSRSEEEFALLPDISGGLDKRLYRAARTASSLDELLAAVKTKRYTMSRVKRVTMRAVLGLYGRGDGTIPYIRVLAIGEKGYEVLKRMKERSAVPFSADVRQLAESSAAAAELLEEEIRAVDFYNLNRRIPEPMGEDFSHRLFVIK